LACLAWISLILIVNQPPDFSTRNRLLVNVAVLVLPSVAFVCGVLGVGTGVYYKRWLAGVTGAVGVAIVVFEALAILANR
jgi:hypothetical protein